MVAAGLIGFDGLGTAPRVQRVATYRSGPEGNASAKDNVVPMFDPVAEAESFTAEAARSYLVAA